MSDFFTAFPTSTKEEWEQKIRKDLKENDPALLNVDDPIEELCIKGYNMLVDVPSPHEQPGNFPYTRGTNRSDNSWNNGVRIEIHSEQAANKKALKALNSGADLLIFDPGTKSTDWSIVLKEIQLEYIQTHFILHTMDQWDKLSALVQPDAPFLRFSVDFLQNQKLDFPSFARTFATSQNHFCSVNGFAIQQAGGTSWQELAFSLSAGHAYLDQLMQNGLSIDQAAACIHFYLGVGCNYFFEIAKFRAMRRLWAKVVATYQPTHACSHYCAMTAFIGHTNKTLKDPHTNLLRQTTEAMSAVNGGVDGLCILPYDALSIKGTTELSERMARNISLILKEEAIFDKVIDPLGGSYNLEILTDQIARKAWSEFQQIEGEGGVWNSSCRQRLAKSVEEKKQARIDALQNNKQTLIGLNKFENPEEVHNTWKASASYLEFSPVQLENEYRKTTV